MYFVADTEDTGEDREHRGVSGYAIHSQFYAPSVFSVFLRVLRVNEYATPPEEVRAARRQSS